MDQAALPSTLSAPAPVPAIMNAWQPDSPMLTARSGFGALVIDGDIWAFGGATSEGLTAYGERSRVQADGKLGRWTPAYYLRLPFAISDFSVVIYNGYVYLVGGAAGAGPLGMLQYARIITGYGFESWRFATLPQGGGWLARVVAIKGFLFVFVGQTGSKNPSPSAVAWRAPINHDGSIGSWSELGDLGIIAAGNALGYGDWIYLFGGFGYHIGLNDVYRMRVGNDGALSSVETMAPMNVPRDALQAAVLGEKIYVAGGDNEFYIRPPTVTNERASILPDGTLSLWERLPDFGVQRLGPRIVATGASVYALGGSSVQAHQTLSTTERLWIAPYTQALPVLWKGTLP